MIEEVIVETGTDDSCMICDLPADKDRDLIRVETLRGNLLGFVHSPVAEPLSRKNRCYREYLRSEVPV